MPRSNCTVPSVIPDDISDYFQATGSGGCWLKTVYEISNRLLNNVAVANTVSKNYVT